MAQGLRSWIEPFEMQRFQLLAGVLQARMIVVEVPGFGAAGTRLLADERRALFAGDFSPLAARMLTAATSAIVDEAVPELSFLGYSMGASLTAAMANVASAQGIAVEHLCLVEPVALRPWRIDELVTATRFENRLIDGYLITNESFDGAVEPWDRRAGVSPATHRRRDLLFLAIALSRGGLTSELLSRSGGPRHIVVVRGYSSLLAHADPATVLRQLRRDGATADELVVPGHHAFWHSLPAVNEMARRLRTMLDESH
ncbi:hypothetical protein [Mycobacterium sp. GA-1841]|uniref:hypothetical protein n=1 Tax=Mycobacterium sp. GA-1841 TaxID=1834154 RepID=UPI0020C9DF87|nr:hypothetical protein [Mycobacterium sp. GA-1841]